MNTQIIPSGSGFLVGEPKKQVLLPFAELLNVGCQSCVWKLHSQCPYGLTGDEEYESKKNGISSSTLSKGHDEQAGPEGMALRGICPEMIQFLGSFSDGTGNINKVWEGFHLYKVRLQENKDYADFMRLESEIKKLESELFSMKRLGGNTENSKNTAELLESIQMKRNAAKIWWYKLSQHVLDNVRDMNNRESRKTEQKALPGIYGAQTVNFNITPEKKQLEEK